MAIAEVELELKTLEAFTLRTVDALSRVGDLGGQALGVEAVTSISQETPQNPSRQKQTPEKQAPLPLQGVPPGIAAGHGMRHEWPDQPTAQCWHSVPPQ